MLKSSAFTIVFTGFAQLCALLGLPVLAVQIGQVAFGEFAALFSMAAIISTLGLLRIELAVLDNSNYKAAHNYIFCILIATALFTAVLLLTTLLLGALEASLVTLIYATILFNCTNVLLSNFRYYVFISVSKFLVPLGFFSHVLFFSKVTDVVSLLLIFAFWTLLGITLQVLRIFLGDVKFFSPISKKSFVNFIELARPFAKYTFLASVASSGIYHALPIISAVYFSSDQSAYIFLAQKLVLAPVGLIAIALGPMIRKELMAATIKGRARANFFKMMKVFALGSLFYGILLIVAVESNALGYVGYPYANEIADIIYFMAILPIILILYVPASQLYLVLKLQKQDLFFQATLLVSLAGLFALLELTAISISDMVVIFCGIVTAVYTTSIIYISSKLNNIETNNRVRSFR